MNTEQIQRITHMEALLDRALALLPLAETSSEAFSALVQTAAELESYYTGPLWKKDYGDDENGLLPRDLKRGVLSEDGIWNLLIDVDSLILEQQKDSAVPTEKE